jgi:hypothetical protein
MFRKPVQTVSTLAIALAIPLLPIALVAASAQDTPPAGEEPAPAEVQKSEVEKPEPESMPPASPTVLVPDKPAVRKDMPEAPPSPVFVPAPPAPVTTTIAPPPPMVAPARTNEIIINKEGNTAQLVGQISDGIANRLNAELKKNSDIKTLVLTSEGGLLIEGVALAHIVRKYQLNTHVEFLCGSACTFPLLAGKERSLAPGALVGFHQASTMLSPLLGTPDGVDDPGNKLIRITYANARVGGPIIDGTMATPPADMWFPDMATLSSNGVITRAAKPGEFAMTMSDWKSVNDYRAALNVDPLWATAKTSRPEDYAYAAGAGWILAGRQKDKAGALRAARSALVRRLLSSAPAYPDALLEEFVKTEQMIWKASSSAFNRDCDYGAAIRFPVSAPDSKEHRSAQLAVLQKMMAIAPRKEPTDGGARSDARATVMNFWGRMVAEQSFNTYNVATNFCREPTSYFEEMAKMPAAEGMNLLRSLILVQTIGMR